MPKVSNIRTEKIRANAIPQGAVYIGRASRGGWSKSKWANVFVIGKDGHREEVIAKYEHYVCDGPLLEQIGELRGRDLVCWCAPEPCHGDVLLRLANQ